VFEEVFGAGRRSWLERIEKFGGGLLSLDVYDVIVWADFATLSIRTAVFEVSSVDCFEVEMERCKPLRIDWSPWPGNGLVV
ncbi:hypothetical protein, partial [Erythrobacter sp. HI0063]|uniref:hypothetical protein n=1 Tax=Erythrobacter sp. HI0063 TaxID=1822240 RepID=UPI000A5363B8